MNQLIEVDGLVYQYPGIESEPRLVLKNITFNIEAGEYVAIIGANGSGKTTLARHFNALLQPSGGRVLINGLDTRQASHRHVIHKTVGMIFQQPEDQVVASIVEDDVAFGPENYGLDPKEIRKRVEESLQLTNLWEFRNRPSHMLSSGQLQRLAIAGVIAMRPSCIVLDEATSMLDPIGRQDVKGLISQLQKNGTTIIDITHFMDEAVSADRIIVLHEGQIVIDGNPGVVFNQASTLRSFGLDVPFVTQVAETLRPVLPQISKLIFNVPDLIRGIPNYPKQKSAEILHKPLFDKNIDKTDVLVDVSGLIYDYMRGTPLVHRALNGLSLQVYSHQTSGLLGATGAGKSTFLQHLNGLLRPMEGSVKVGPYDLNNPKVDLKSLRKMVGLVFQSPEMQLFERYVGDEIAYGPRLMFGKETLHERVEWAMKMVGLNFEKDKDRLTFSLSGGERRKVALASTLAMKPELLLLDEPFAGLDPLAKCELVERLKGLKKSGCTLVLSSHDMENVAAVADNLTVISQGRNIISGSVQEVFSQGLILRSLGLDLPIVSQVVEGFRDRGWPIPAGMTDISILANTVASLSHN